MQKRAKTDPSDRPAMCLRLKQIRELTGFKGWQMAEILGVVGGQPTYKTYETRTRPTREIVGMVERRLGVPAKALLDNGGVSDEEFNEYLQELRARMPKVLAIFNQIHTLASQGKGVGTTSDNPAEGEMGQDTTEAIFRLIRMMGDQIERNSKAIQDLTDEIKKPGFRKGRN